MWKGVVKVLSAAGMIFLLLCCAACAGQDGTPATATDATATDAETTAAVDLNALPVEEYPAAVALACQRTEDGDGALEGWKNDDPARGYFEPMLMRAAASEIVGGETVFDIVIRCDEGRAYQKHAFEGQIVARRGGAWLFALRDPGISDTYYLYDTSRGVLTSLGRDVALRLCGDAILVLPSSDGSYAPRTLTVFDWTGKTVQSLEGITDFRLYGGAVYLLTDGAPMTLDRLDEAALTAPFGNRLPERVCDFSGYTAEFIANTDDGVFLFPRSGRKILSCNVAGAAACMDALKNGNSLPAEALSARCDLFTVVLPESWLGEYVCETSSTRVTFFHKASREAGMNGYLFSLYAVPMSDAENYVYEAQAVANYNDNGDLRCILLGGPTDVQYAEEYRDEYEQMRQDRFAVVRSLSMAHPYSETWLNYQGFRWGTFRGTDGAGNVYTFTPQLITDRGVEGEMTFAAYGAGASEPVSCYAEMDGGAGTLSWYAPENVGGAALEVKHEAALLLTLVDIPAGWQGASGETVTLTALR